MGEAGRVQVKHIRWREPHMSRFFVSASTDDRAPHGVSCKEIAGADLLSMLGSWRRVAAGPAFGEVLCETHYVAPDSSLAAC